MRSTYTKNWESSPSGVKEGATFANGKYQVRPSCPAQSEWFDDFLQGLEFRMGCQSDPNHGLLMGAIVHLLDLIKIDAEEAEEAEAALEANELWKVGVYVCILTAALLRGHKGFYLELARLRKHLSKGKMGIVPAGMNKSTLLTKEACRNLPHVTVCLLGKFKGKTGIDHHLITLANKTVSGLQPRWWIKKLVCVCKWEGRVNGPAFATPDGELALSVDYDTMFRRYLLRVQEETSFIPEDQERETWYSTNRSLRKTAVTHLEHAGFGNKFINRMNRWRAQQQSKGRFVRCRMNAHYAAAMLLAPTTWLGSYFL
jgi:hypothetical protein